MREIKFRGKTINNGEWVYGYLVDELHIAWKNFNGKSYEEEVIPETIGQYTGLKDINGEEVYEGDIIKFVNNKYYIHPYEVRWENCSFCYIDYWVEVYGGLDEDDIVEVIGNIHDNPELMKGE